MRLICLAVLMAASVVGTARADVQSSGPPSSGPVALSVWAPGDGGVLEHRQSGLACPAAFRGYTRTEVHVFDHYGLDVSCNYLEAGTSDITVYLTRRAAGANVADAMTEAKREYLEVRASLHPQFISESQPGDERLKWDLALYSTDGGSRDTIWIGDVDGWTLEYRVSFNAPAGPQVDADMAELTKLVERSAGDRLDLCGKAPIPMRTGVAAPSDDHSGADALMSAITAAAANQDAKGGPPPAPVLWCAEKPMSAGGNDLLFWRGVDGDGRDAGVDQVTAISRDASAPVELMASSDPDMAKIERELKRPARWEATVSAPGGSSNLYAYFTARPTPEALGGLYLAILAGEAHPLSGYDAKTRTVIIGMPGK